MGDGTDDLHFGVVPDSCGTVNFDPNFKWL